MLKLEFTYPEDPVEIAEIMTGEEFIRTYRPDGVGRIFFETSGSTELVSEFTEIICDVCNGEVGLEDYCSIISGYLRCAECSKDVEKYLPITWDEAIERLQGA